MKLFRHLNEKQQDETKLVTSNFNRFRLYISNSCINASAIRPLSVSLMRTLAVFNMADNRPKRAKNIPKDEIDVDSETCKKDETERHRQQFVRGRN